MADKALFIEEECGRVDKRMASWKQEEGPGESGLITPENRKPYRIREEG